MNEEKSNELLLKFSHLMGKDIVFYTVSEKAICENNFKRFSELRFKKIKTKWEKHRKIPFKRDIFLYSEDNIVNIKAICFTFEEAIKRFNKEE